MSAAAALAVLLAACTGGEAPPRAARPTPSASASPSGKPAAREATQARRPTPPFRFQLAGIHRSLTADLLPARARGAARRPARKIKERFDALFRMSYVDRDSWRDGIYGLARFFGGQVLPEARHHLGVLTLGRDAGRRFESVRGAGGRLRVNVLVGPRGGPVTASVHATFKEKAVGKDGRTAIVVSDGVYFLRPGKAGWVIDAFTVRRHDRPARG